MSPKDLSDKAKRLLAACRKAGVKVATAESCTGGLIAGTLTEIAGSSDVVERGFVTYSNEAKTDLVGVSEETLSAHGAVSEPVAREMAEGALQRSRADIAVSVTGIAGPGGATPGKPVGLVHLACARRGAETLHRRIVFTGNRAAVRRKSVDLAFRLVQRQLRAGR
jgi:nicotinamide-nucleotide amidase